MKDFSLKGMMTPRTERALLACGVVLALVLSIAGNIRQRTGPDIPVMKRAHIDTLAVRHLAVLDDVGETVAVLHSTGSGKAHLSLGSNDTSQLNLVASNDVPSISLANANGANELQLCSDALFIHRTETQLGLTITPESMTVFDANQKKAIHLGVDCSGNRSPAALYLMDGNETLSAFLGVGKDKDESHAGLYLKNKSDDLCAAVVAGPNGGAVGVADRIDGKLSMQELRHHPIQLPEKVAAANTTPERGPE